MRGGTIDKYELQCVILRSSDLAAVTDRTPIPTSGIFPEALKSPFPNWSPQQVHDYLKLHAPGTKIYRNNFVIIDARILVDYTCEVADSSMKFSETGSMHATGHELKTVRASFRDSILTLVNLDIANYDIEEVQMNIEGEVSMVGETAEGRKKDLEGATLAETVLRSGKVVRDQD